jgi:hypothetical protein
MSGNDESSVLLVDDAEDTIVKSEISGNRAGVQPSETCKSGRCGGGVEGCRSSGVSIVNSTIPSNSAEYGGGIFLSECSYNDITNSTITGNTATPPRRGIPNSYELESRG